MKMMDKALTMEEMELVAGGARGPRIKSRKCPRELARDVTNVVHTVKKLLVQNKDKIFDTIFPSKDPKPSQPKNRDYFREPGGMPRIDNPVFD